MQVKSCSAQLDYAEKIDTRIVSRQQAQQAPLQGAARRTGSLVGVTTEASATGMEVAGHQFHLQQELRPRDSSTVAHRRH